MVTTRDRVLGWSLHFNTDSHSVIEMETDLHPGTKDGDVGHSLNAWKR